jgi:hypothetical protein
MQQVSVISDTCHESFHTRSSIDMQEMLISSDFCHSTPLSVLSKPPLFIDGVSIVRIKEIRDDSVCWKQVQCPIQSQRFCAHIAVGLFNILHLDKREAERAQGGGAKVWRITHLGADKYNIKMDSRKIVFWVRIEFV